RLVIFGSLRCAGNYPTSTRFGHASVADREAAGTRLPGVRGHIGEATVKTGAHKPTRAVSRPRPDMRRGHGGVAVSDGVVLRRYGREDLGAMDGPGTRGAKSIVSAIPWSEYS